VKIRSPLLSALATTAKARKGKHAVKLMEKEKRRGLDGGLDTIPAGAAERRNTTFQLQVFGL